MNQIWAESTCPLDPKTGQSARGSRTRRRSGSAHTRSIGQQTLFTLDDGSVVHLNTQSILTVRMTESSCDLDLTRGEAMFEVAKDPTRPFRVKSGSVVVQVIGTRFNVYRRNDGVQVTVVEGEAKVESLPTRTAVAKPSAEVHLPAGQEAQHRHR